MEKERRSFRPGAPVVVLVVWTALGVLGAVIGYRMIRSACPPVEDWDSCFEAPYRFAASVVFVWWALGEIGLFVAWLVSASSAVHRREALKQVPADEFDSPGRS